MNRTLTQRLAAAFASVAVTLVIVSGVAGLAQSQAEATLVAHAAPTTLAAR